MVDPAASGRSQRRGWFQTAIVVRIAKRATTPERPRWGSPTARPNCAAPDRIRPKVLTTSALRGIYDMRKWATLVFDMETRDESGILVAENTAQIIVRDAGGFGGSPAPKDENPAPKPKDKERAPDFVEEELTSPEQALLYRLSGDRNPLHADPEFAAKVGFVEGPILHGLCTFGYMVRHAAKGMAGGDPSRLSGFCAPFRRPVWPGDTIVTKGYKVTDKAYALEVSVKERPDAVIIGGWATLS